MHQYRCSGAVLELRRGLHNGSPAAAARATAVVVQAALQDGDRVLRRLAVVQSEQARVCIFQNCCIAVFFTLIPSIAFFSSAMAKHLQVALVYA